MGGSEWLRVFRKPPEVNNLKLMPVLYSQSFRPSESQRRACFMTVQTGLPKKVNGALL